MSPERRARLIALTATWFSAKCKFEILGLQNTSGLTYERRAEQALDYELARTEMMDARSELDAVQREGDEP